MRGITDLTLAGNKKALINFNNVTHVVPVGKDGMLYEVWFVGQNKPFLVETSFGGLTDAIRRAMYDNR